MERPHNTAASTVPVLYIKYKIKISRCKCKHTKNFKLCCVQQFICKFAILILPAEDLDELLALHVVYSLDHTGQEESHPHMQVALAQGL